MAFGSFRLSPQERALRKDGELVRIGARALEILIVLAEGAGQIVSRRDLILRVWPNMTVEEGALRVHIAGLRRVLGDDVRYIENVPGRGYCLVAPVTWDHAESGAAGRRAPYGGAVHNLPSRLSRLIGREEIVSHLTESARANRLVTVTGTGGIGKTSVALAAATRLLDDFDRICFVDLSLADDPEKASRVLATSLGSPDMTADVLPGVQELLRDRRTLLIFDSCEHVLDEASRLAGAILGRVADVHILCTSRERLGLDDEQIEKLAPLDMPDGGARISADEALKSPAVQLFVERAEASGAAFRLEDADAPYVADICRQLDGIPLALELAAAWVGAVPPKTLAQQLDGHLLLEASAQRTAQARHRTLQAMLDWSHRRLDAGQQVLFRRLAVFRREFALDAAIAVAAHDGLDATSVTECLQELAAKSLVEIGHRGGEIYYRLLAVPRAFGLERLGKLPEHHPTRRRHAQLVLGWLEGCEADWIGQPRAVWVERYARIVDDVRAVLDWAISSGLDLELATDVTWNSAAVWFRLSLLYEGRKYAEAMLEALTRTRLPDARREMKLKATLGVVQSYSGIHDMPLWDRIESLATALGDNEHLMLTLWGQWQCLLFKGQPQKLLALAERFKALAATEQPVAHRIAAERMLSIAHYQLGNLQESRERMEQLLAYHVTPVQQTGVIRFQLDQVVSGRTLLALVLWLQGFPEQALQHAVEGVKAAEATEHGITMGWALLEGLAQTAILVGDLAAAEGAIARMSAFSANVHSPMRQGEVGLVRGIIAGERKSFRDVAEALRAVKREYRIYFIAKFSTIAGRVPAALGATGDIAGGMEIVDGALTILGANPTEVVLPELRRVKAELILASGRPGAQEEAEALFQAAMAQASAQATLGWQARTAVSFARLRLGQGRPSDAVGILQPIADKITEGFDTPDFQACFALLETLGVSHPRAALRSPARPG
ncbi:MAG: winged helix-turn-helix domain-containing protein [Rhizomicrobium sp.]